MNRKGKGTLLSSAVPSRRWRATGSTTGAFRLQRDVLSQGPLDLLFVEFAVNDDQDSEDSYKEALENIIPRRSF